MLASFYLWQDEDERKRAVRFWNDYEDLKAQLLASRAGTFTRRAWWMRGWNMSKFTLPDPPARVTVRYDDLCGVDLSSEQRSVAPQRASYAQNMYKKYVDGYSNFWRRGRASRRWAASAAGFIGMYFWGTGLWPGFLCTRGQACICGTVSPPRPARSVHCAEMAAGARPAFCTETGCTSTTAGPTSALTARPARR